MNTTMKIKNNCYGLGLRLPLAAFFCSLAINSLHAQVPQLINYQGRVAVGTTNFNGQGSFKFALVDQGDPTVPSHRNRTTSNLLPHTPVSHCYKSRIRLRGRAGSDFQRRQRLGCRRHGDPHRRTRDFHRDHKCWIRIYSQSNGHDRSAPPGNAAITYWSNSVPSVGGNEPPTAVTLTVTKGLYSVLLGDTSPPLSMTAIATTVFNNSDVRLRVWFNDGTNGSQLLTPDQRIAAVGYAMMAGNVSDGTITTAKIAAGAVAASNLAPNAVTASNLAPNTVGSANLLTIGAPDRVWY